MLKRIRALLTGDFQHREFREAVAWLDDEATLHCEPQLHRAVEHIRQCREPFAIIIVAQSRPGQFASHEIEKLYGAAPLSRMVALLGSWCEGEPRSGRPWPGVVRVYWHQFAARCGSEFRRLLDHTSHSRWTMPRTASDAEQLMNVAAYTLPQQRGLVAIQARTFVNFDVLADACRAGGFSAVWLLPRQPVHVAGVSAILWDTAECASGVTNEMQQLRCHVDKLPGVPVVALLDFPRLHDKQRVIAAGAAAVVSKPFLLEDLHWQLERVVEPRQISNATAFAA